MSDYVIVSMKRGDKIHAPGKIELLHGHPVDYHDPDKYNPTLSEYCRAAFLFFRIPKTLLPLVEDYLVVPERERKFARKRQFDLTKISQVIDIGGITNMRNSREILPVFDITMMAAEDIFKANRKYEVTDLKAHTSGTKYIGSGGTDDFPTHAQGHADLANMLGDIFHVQRTGVVETAASTMTENLAGHTFTIMSNFLPRGNPQMGHLVDLAFNGNFLDHQQEGPGLTVIKDLRVGVSVACGGLVINVSNVAVGFTWRLKNSLLDGAGNLAGVGVGINDADVISELYNLKIWDVASGGTGRALRYSVGAGASKIENLTIYGCDTGIDNQNQAMTYRDCALLSNTANFSNNANSISASCGTDAAGVGAAVNNTPQNNATIADEMEGVADTKGDFLHLKRYSHYRRIGGIFHKNGEAPTIAENITDIAGNPRPHRGGAYSIGAHEVHRKLGCYYGMGR